MTIDTNALKEHFFDKAIPTDKDFSTLIDLAATGQNAVVDNHDNTITANNLTYDLSKSCLTPLQYVDSGSFNDLPLGTVMADATVVTGGPDTTRAFTTTTFYYSDWGGRKAQIAIADNANLMYFRVGTGKDTGTDTDISWNSWTLLSDDSKVVHSTEIDPSVMVKRALTADDDVLVLDPGTYWLWGTAPKNYPALSQWATVVVREVGDHQLDGKSVTITDVDGSQLINTYSGGPSTWLGWQVPNAVTMASKSDVTTAISAATATKADDTTVVHKTGANNFDTVPTYGANNKPFAINDNGATSDRPTIGIYAGYQYYDTDLKKPIWYNGSAWTDSTGAKV